MRHDRVVYAPIMSYVPYYTCAGVTMMQGLSRKGGYKARNSCMLRHINKASSEPILHLVNMHLGSTVVSCYHEAPILALACECAD